MTQDELNDALVLIQTYEELKPRYELAVQKLKDETLADANNKFHTFDLPNGLSKIFLNKRPAGTRIQVNTTNIKQMFPYDSLDPDSRARMYKEVPVEASCSMSIVDIDEENPANRFENA